MGEPPVATIREVRRIWSEGPHNAFTDLVYFDQQWLCVFREGKDHVSFDGRVRVLASSDGKAFHSISVLSMPAADLRDPKICVTPDQRLMLTAGLRLAQDLGRTLAWFSYDGVTWTSPQPIGADNDWLWRVTWSEGIAYAVGYSWTEPSGLRLYTSRAGRSFQPIEAPLIEEGSPNETTLVFTPDDLAYALVRREAGSCTAMLGRARPPYTDWSWEDTGQPLGGPGLLRLPDGRLVAAGRVRAGSEEGPRTALLWLDAASGNLTEFLELPSGGDTSYPGLVWHQDLLWVSYYSSHEGQTSIYLAQVELPPAE